MKTRGFQSKERLYSVGNGGHWRILSRKMAKSDFYFERRFADPFRAESLLTNLSKLMIESLITMVLLASMLPSFLVVPTTLWIFSTNFS